MKKIITLLALISTLITFSQVPQGISYQAIALNGSANPVVSSNVGIRLSVLDNSATGTVLYTETHTKTTNAQGLFNLVIGQGTPTTGTFSTINWGTNLKFLKVEMDAAGGTNYVLVGTTQLLSVPYAMVAGSVSNSSKSISFNGNSGNGKGAVYSTSEARGFNGTTWSSAVTFTSTILGADASNSSLAVYSSNEIRGYNGTTWSSVISLSGNIIAAIHSNTDVLVYSNSEARVYNGTTWGTSGTLTTPIVGAVSSNSNFVIYSNNEVKGSNGTTWSSTNTLNGTIIGAFASGDNIIVYSTSEARVYNGTTWSSAASFTGTVTSGVGMGN